jgi:hypothetical protein
MRKLAALAKRLAAGEQRRRPRCPVIVWRNVGEDRDAAIARHLAERPADTGRRIHLIAWGRRLPDWVRPLSKGTPQNAG